MNKIAGPSHGYSTRRPLGGVVATTPGWAETTVRDGYFVARDLAKMVLQSLERP